MGLLPPVLRECYFDEIAAVFGIDREREPQVANGPEVPSGRDVIAERLAYAAGLGPEPEADPIPPSSPLLAYAMTPEGAASADPERRS